MLKVRISTSISSRLSGDRKPLPKPFYFRDMNPEEQMIWGIIGEQKTEYYRDRKGKLHKRVLTRSQRAQNQKMFYDSRVGHAIVGDEWMRMQLPTRKK